MKRYAPEEPPEDTTGQLPFDPPRARNTDPHTSHRAARSVSEKASQTIRRRIFAILTERGPMTDEEIATVFAFEHWSGSPSGVRTRRRELVTAGLVYDTGNLRTMASGRVGIVWAAHADGAKR